MKSVNDLIKLSVKNQKPAQTCTSKLAEDPWAFDTDPGKQPYLSYGPGASMSDIVPNDVPTQMQIPKQYQEASAEVLEQKIMSAKKQLGTDLLILGHFYQRDEVIKYADFVGDSFQLASVAQNRTEAKNIVFCGVHFMAETADILSTEQQNVILPNLAAGCSMADMADLESVTQCWEDLLTVLSKSSDNEKQAVIPITYMNSSAALKAFCGENGGIVCTSSNAKKVMEWAFLRGERVLFFPDQHLGRNTAKAMGIAESEIALWNPLQVLGGNTSESLHNSKVLLWHGFCSVHRRFNIKQIAKARQEYPNVRVIVHPECTAEVVDSSDESGSTDYIVKAIASAEAGTTFAIGTEINLVNRLANMHPEHKIFCLDPVICPCSTMYRIHPSYLAWVLESILEGKIVNKIKVSTETQTNAKIALQRMLHVKPA